MYGGHKSGYRSPDTHEVALVTHYDEVLTEVRRQRIAQEVAALLHEDPDLQEEEALERANADDHLRESYEHDPFTIVILMGQVRTIGPFDAAMYGKHFKPANRSGRPSPDRNGAGEPQGQPEAPEACVYRRRSGLSRQYGGP